MAKKSKIGKHIAALPACLLIMACSPAEPSESDLRLAYKNAMREGCKNDLTGCQCYIDKTSAEFSLETIKSVLAAVETNEIFDMDNASEEDNAIFLRVLMECSE